MRHRRPSRAEWTLSVQLLHMQEDTGIWLAPSGTEIFHRRWQVAGASAARGVVILVHGLGEHSGRYAHVAARLVAQAWVVYALDHQGHGRSGGRRQRIQRFEDLSDTLAAFREWVQAQHPGLPLVLLGHSMGGLLAATDAAQYPHACQALVLSAPAVKVSEHISVWTIRIGRLLSALAPSVGVLGLDPQWVSRDARVVAQYQQDPLVHHGKTPARLAAELLRAIEDLQARVGRIQAPLLVLQGSADRLVDPGGAQWLAEHAGSRDKQARYFEGLYHEVLNEPEQEAVLAELVAWLNARVPPPAMLSDSDRCAPE